MSNKRVCMLIPQLLLPIPDVQGGAVETLITNLLDENENENRVRFVVISKYNKEASEKQYKNSKIYYFDNNQYVGKSKIFIKILWLLYKSIMHVIQNKITYKLFACNYHVVDYVTFQYLCIAKKEKVDFVSIEADENEYELSAFNKLIGKHRVYNHIHYTRRENLASRRLIPNSICISKYVKNEWAKSDTVKGDNKVLYNGISLDGYDSTKSDIYRNDVRNKLGIKETDILVVFCGRIMKVKGVEQLLDAFSRIDNPNIKLLLIGSAPAGNKGYREFAEKTIEKANNMNNVICLGYVDNHILPMYYSASDIMVIPSICQEGAGLVAVEGMASGLPLIITESGGMVEYVNDSCAIKLPIDDNLPVSLAKEILKLSKDRQLRENMGKCGRERAKLFSKSQYYKDFINIIEAT